MPGFLPHRGGARAHERWTKTCADFEGPYRLTPEADTSAFGHNAAWRAEVNGVIHSEICAVPAERHSCLHGCCIDGWRSSTPSYSCPRPVT